ncbi:MAG: histidine kinase N-terminal 7TM domain-containing protein [Anaerolineae bacterium]
MNSLTLFLLSLTLSTLILLFLGIYARRYRHRKAVTAFAITMLTLVLWSGGLIFELTSSTLAAKLFWANVQFLGITFLPLVWLWMTADYTGWGDRLKWPLRFSAVIPLATNLIIWTNDFHHLFRGQPYLDTISAPFPVLVNDYGPWFFWVHVSSGNLLQRAIDLLKGWRVFNKLPEAG